MLEAGVVAAGDEILGVDGLPDLGHGGLDLGAHLAVVDADAAVGVDLGGLAGGEVIGEQAHDLLDGALMGAVGLHDLVEDRGVERHHRNGGAGLGDQGLVDADPGATADAGGEFGVELQRRCFEVVLGGADGALAVDGVGDLGADVAVGDRAEALGQQAGALQRAHPALPILTTHDLDGVGDLFRHRRIDGDRLDHVGVGVDGLAGIDRADRLEHAAVGGAGGGIGALGAGQRVDEGVDRSEAILQGGDGLVEHSGRERITDDRLDGLALGLGLAVDLGEVVPTSRTGLFAGTRALEGHRQHLGAMAEERGDGRSQAVAAGRAHHQHVAQALTGASLSGDRDLLPHIHGATLGMRGGADEATDTGIDDDVGHGWLRTGRENSRAYRSGQRLPPYERRQKLTAANTHRRRHPAPPGART